MGQTHVHTYLHLLLHWIEQVKIDPAFIVTHRLSLEEAPQAYELFKQKKDECLKVILQPNSRQEFRTNRNPVSRFIPAQVVS